MYIIPIFMQKNNGIFSKLRRRFLKLRLKPIRVLCFHQVSECLDSDIYCDADWISLSDFKATINSILDEGYQFISLEEAYHHIKHDFIRIRKYAVLTADDGLKCQLELIPWLEENDIPLTMFLNVETLSGNKCGEPIRKYFNIISKEQEQAHAVLYATADDILATQSPIISFGLHGVDHRSSICISKDDFAAYVEECNEHLSKITPTIPFYAYTYGFWTSAHNKTLRNANLVPVYMDGNYNYNDSTCIHRELIK